jgi:hypothetical protein
LADRLGEVGICNRACTSALTEAAIAEGAAIEVGVHQNDFAEDEVIESIVADQLANDGIVIIWTCERRRCWSGLAG